MAINLKGQITDEQGNLTGGQVNLATGQMTTPNAISPVTGTSITSEDLATAFTPKIEPSTPLKAPDVSGIPVTEPTEPKKPEIGSDFNKRLEDVMANIEGRTKESDIKVATASQQRELNEINLQIKMHQAASLKTEEEALEKGETLSFASGESARVARNNAVRALELSAIAQAKQGNLALATDLAGSAIDEKYKKQEQDLRIQRANVVNNYDSFTASQKKRADALLLKLDKDDAFVKEQKEKEKALTDVGNKAAGAGAPISAVREALATGDIIKANSLLAPYLQPTSGIVGEYNFYVQQEKTAGRTPVSFNEYQNMDANRKATIARAGVGATGLSSQQYTALNQVTTRFQADKIINQAVNGQTATAIADQIIANPDAATSQLKSLYILVKNLDPDSAVREGELALANQTQSYLQQFGNVLTRINEGRVISPQAAKELATATKELVIAWNATAQKRQKQYESQAKGLDIGDEFSSYIKSSELGFNAPSQEPQAGTPEATPIGSTVVIGGKIYLRTSEDNFEPIGSAVK